MFLVLAKTFLLYKCAPGLSPKQPLCTRASRSMWREIFCKSELAFVRMREQTSLAMQPSYSESVTLVVNYVYLRFRARQHLRSLAPIMNDNEGQMRFGDLGGLNLPDIRLTGEEKPRKNLTQETCPNWGSNPGLLRDSRTCFVANYCRTIRNIWARNVWIRNTCRAVLEIFLSPKN